jgi:hypothetical protein
MTPRAEAIAALESLSVAIERGQRMGIEAAQQVRSAISVLRDPATRIVSPSTRTVRAVQLTWRNWNEVCELLNGHEMGFNDSVEDPKARGCYVGPDGNATEDTNGRIGLWVPGPNGAWLAVEGDWIVLGPSGELSSCKPELFAALFTPGAA